MQEAARQKSERPGESRWRHRFVRRSVAKYYLVRKVHANILMAALIGTKVHCHVHSHVTIIFL
jgi:hypothetical protein